MALLDLYRRLVKGSALSYEEVDANFEELDRRSGRGWRDNEKEVNIRAGTSSPGSLTIRDGLIAYSFPADTIAECFVNFHINHDYIAGTMIYPHVHWVTPTTSTGTVRWGVEYTLARRADDTGLTHFGPTQTLYIENTITDGADAQYKHMVNESADGGGIDGTDLKVDCLVMCRFFRDAAHVNDTYPDPVGLLTVDIHYECDIFATPLRGPPFL
jgi:hypothetical protein